MTNADFSLAKRNRRSEPKRPALWLQMSVPAGNSLQICGLLIGAALLYTAARLAWPAAGRVVLMIAGFLAVCVCCHALVHWLVGIRFRAYGVRGTDHPETYPPGVRQLMSAMPFFTAMTERASMQVAGPVARAFMFAAGETSTTVCSLLAAGFAWRSGIPGGNVLFDVVVVFSAFSTVVTAITPRGDYAKAIRALRASSVR